MSESNFNELDAGLVDYCSPAFFRFRSTVTIE
jgi:hypothetical protein